MQCGHYHPGKGDQRFVTSLSDFYDQETFYARQPPNLTPQEYNNSIMACVLENPNHLVEYLISEKLQNLSEQALTTAFSQRMFPTELKQAFLDKGIIPDANMIQLRAKFNQRPRLYNPPPLILKHGNFSSAVIP